MSPDLSHDACVAIVRGRDTRYDGVFWTGVTSTGIYCRPSCPAMTPRADRMRFYPSAAAAQRAGFRACQRCLPDAVPGSPEWDVRGDVTARAVRLIREGVVDREGVAGLASRLGYSSRQLGRLLTAELGAGPLALARAQRAQTARVLLTSSALPVSEVAFAAGFGSLRQFNDTIREVYAATPSQLREASRRLPERAARASVELRLPFRPPLEVSNLFGHLVATAVPGVEEWRDGAYRRTLVLPHGLAILCLRPRPDHVAARIELDDVRDLTLAVQRARFTLDLDADPAAVDVHLATDPVLAPLVAAAPGRRVPHAADPHEMAIRAMLGQQVSTAAARRHAARLVHAHGTGVADATLTHTFPSMAAIAALSPADLAMPRARATAILGLAAALADGSLPLDAGADRDDLRARLAALPGIGPWTVETILMRAVGDPDAFCGTDLGVQGALRELGLPTSGRALAARTEAWRPWRAYAVQHLWATQPHAVNTLPEETA